MKYLSLTLLFFLSFTIISCNNSLSDDRDEALAQLDARIKKNPDDASLYYQRGKLLIDLGKEKQQSNYFKEAILDLDRSVQLDGSKPEYFTALADAHFSLGDVSQSYSALQKALNLDKNNFEASLKMGEIAFYSRDYDRAMESLSKVTEQDKTNQTALFMKGFIYKETGDTANAVFYFRKVIDLYPEYEPAYEELGMLYAQHGNKLGLEYLSTALSLDPNNINVLYGLAMMYQDVEDPEKAEEYYVKILEIDPTYKYAWYNRGWMEMILYQDYDNAIDFFNKAIECDPLYAEAYYNLGVAYELSGNKSKAQEAYTTAASLGYKKIEN